VKRHKKPSRRFGIGEWYGRLFAGLKSGEKRELAQVQFMKPAKRPPMHCPFRSATAHLLPCRKEGGICSIRIYELDPATRQVSVVSGPGSQLVTTCPYRFMQDGVVFRWVGETLLGTPTPLVVGEVGFLERAVSRGTSEGKEKKKEVGRIDNVLVHPGLETLHWCALEKQAVYFSGRGMKKEFRRLRTTHAEGVPFPSEHRRPDFRSSGAKRLMPQLQIKVPTLRRWGKKMAVVGKQGCLVLS